MIMPATSPPPIPISEDEAPIVRPYPAIGLQVGISAARQGSLSLRMSRAAVTSAIATKTSLNTSAGANRAMMLPARTPARIGTHHARSTAMSTAPLLRWAQN